MKKKGHPKYQDVLFIDTATNFKFVCGSTLESKETEKFEGKEYPVCRVSISSASHPFFTGSQQFVDSEGRVDKFLKRYAKKEPVKESPASEEKKSEKRKLEKGVAKKAPAKKPSTKKTPAKKAVKKEEKES